MILIKKGDKVFLPRDYHFINNVCAHLYDLIGEVITDDYYLNMANTDVEFNDANDKLKELINDDSIHSLDALLKAGRNDEIEIIVTKHVLMSIIADFSNFIYESIIIAQKGKMSVAYALLRKPFTDQLLILEQILVDRKDFIERYFHIGDPKGYDPSSRDLDKKALIEKALLKLNNPFFQPEEVYELRYDKASDIGINSYTNHALHIVTNDKNYKTENQGLNFTFPLEEDDIDGFLFHYYHAVSMLLLYTSSVVDKIVFDLIKNEDGRKELKFLQRFLASIMLFDHEDKKFSKSMYKFFSKMIVTECEICKHANKFTKRDFDDFFWNKFFTCKRCFNPIDLSNTSLNNLSNIFDNRKPSET